MSVSWELDVQHLNILCESPYVTLLHKLVHSLAIATHTRKQKFLGTEDILL